MMMLYTYAVRRKKTNKKKCKTETQRKHEEFLRSIGYIEKRQPIAEIPNLKVENDNVAELSNDIPGGGGYKRAVDDYKWRRNLSEKPGTIAEIERKKRQVAPLWNKGATMYISEDTDPTTLGKKV